MPGVGLPREMADRIVAAVDDIWEEQLEFTRELVRFPSVRGQEHTAQNFLHDELARRGAHRRAL